MELTREQILANRAKWTGALRLEGDRAFKQATGQLAREVYHTGARSYCCLGVVCEVLGPEFGVRRSEYDSEYYIYFAEEGEDFADDELGDEYRVTLDTSLDGPLLKALGLSENMQNFLIRCNDTFKFTFPEIADLVDVMPVTGFDDDIDDDEFEHSELIPAHLQQKIADYWAEQ